MSALNDHMTFLLTFTAIDSKRTVTIPKNSPTSYPVAQLTQANTRDSPSSQWHQRRDSSCKVGGLGKAKSGIKVTWGSTV